MTAEVILTVILSLQPYAGDADLSDAERAAIDQPVAEAISDAGRTPLEDAELVALAWSETKLSAAIVRGHCEEMPVGQQCDHGRARGVFELHYKACPEAWALGAGTPESIHVEAACAIRLLRYHAWRGREHALTPLQAAFDGYAARPWSWSSGVERETTTWRVLAKLKEAT